MEKLLVCDYDDTIKTSSKYITSINFDALKRFRDNGNKLVIASGREYISLNRELSKYSCSYDALICNDGSIGFDDKNEIIYSKKIDKHQVNDLLYYFRNFGNKYIYGYNLYNYYGFTSITDDILEVAVTPKLLRKVKTMIEEIHSIIPDLDIVKVENKLYIRRNFNKSDGIKEVNKLFNISEDNIYTVGNGKNDYQMIRDYNGYNTFISHPSLYAVSKGTVTSVARLVKKIETK